MYPLSQKVEERHHETCQAKVRRTPERSYLQVSPTRKDKIHLEINRERPGLEKRWERSSTMERGRSINYDTTPSPVLNEAQLKRQDNFNHFITDLDKRI